MKTLRKTCEGSGPLGGSSGRRRQSHCADTQPRRDGGNEVEGLRWRVWSVDARSGTEWRRRSVKPRSKRMDVHVIGKTSVTGPHWVRVLGGV